MTTLTDRLNTYPNIVSFQPGGQCYDKKRKRIKDIHKCSFYKDFPIFIFVQGMGQGGHPGKLKTQIHKWHLDKLRESQLNLPPGWRREIINPRWTVPDRSMMYNYLPKEPPRVRVKFEEDEGIEKVKKITKQTSPKSAGDDVEEEKEESLPQDWNQRTAAQQAKYLKRREKKSDTEAKIRKKRRVGSNSP